MQISAKNLTLGYGNEIIVKSLDFEINQGDFVAVVGENGSGKTTLIKTLAGVIPVIGGELKTPKSVGYLPQNDVAMSNFPASCEEIVRSGLASKPFYSKTDKKLADTVMNRLGILPIAKKSFCNLSGGQKKRVLLARALCIQTDILLLDEPAAALDPGACEELYKILEELNKKDGITIIMISHDIPSALSLATHILHIGDNVFYCKADEYAGGGKN